jgi:hypothetical protein
LFTLQIYFVILFLIIFLGEDMNEVKQLMDQAIGIPTATGPKHLLDMQTDLRAYKRLTEFVRYIYDHHPALFDQAYSKSLEKINEN